MPVPGTDRAPAPLVVAAGLVAVEGLLVVMYAVMELFSLSGGRLTMGLTTAAFFALYGAGLVFFAWAVSRGRSWARAPIALAQLLQLMAAWSFRGSPTTIAAIALAVVAVIVLVGLLHPASLDHLAEEAQP
jgi:hypothetical protein